MLWKEGGSTLIISLGILSSFRVLPLVSLLRLLSNTSLETSFAILWLVGPRFSRMEPLGLRHGYLQIAHWHLGGWSIVSSQRGVCFVNNLCCVCMIYCAMSCGSINMFVVSTFEAV